MYKIETLRFLLTTTFYPPYHIGGDAVHVKYLADELVKRGHEVHVLHSVDAYRVKRKQHPLNESTEGVFTYPIKTLFSHSSYEVYLSGNSSKVTKEFDHLIKEIKPDIVHNHNISLLGYNLLKKRGNYRNLYTAHDYWLICQQNSLFKNNSLCEHPTCFYCILKCRKPLQLWRYSKGFKIARSNIDVLIAPSFYVAEKLSKTLGVNVTILPNFAPELTSNGSSSFSNFFLYAGVLEKHKGILDLINAYQVVHDRTETKLLIAGFGSLDSVIREFVHKNGLSDKVVLLGQADHDLLHLLMKDAKALVLPSIWPENCPLTALEAMSLGTPIIASNKGGLPEILKNGEVGVTYNTLDDLRQILLTFNRDKYSLTKVKSVYDKFYSPESYLEKYLSLIY